MTSRCSIVLAAVLSASLASGAADAQSFDCAKATKADERAICNNPNLSILDDEMNGIYRDIMQRALMGVRGDTGDSQRAFLANRQACGSNAACIAKLYGARIEDLKRIKRVVGQGAAG